MSHLGYIGPAVGLMLTLGGGCVAPSPGDVETDDVARSVARDVNHDVAPDGMDDAPLDVTRDGDSVGAQGDAGPFTILGQFPVGPAGITESIAFERSLDADVLALRVYPTVDTTLCVQLTTLVDGAGEVLVPAQEPNDYDSFCKACEQRVYLGKGYGLYVFPNHGEALDISSELTFEVHLRDCMTRLPPISVASDEAVVVEVLETRVPLQAQGALEVQVAVLEGTRLYGQAPEDDPTLQGALEVMAEAFSLAGLSLVIHEVLQVPFVQGGPLEFGGGEHDDLDVAYRLAVAQRGLTTSGTEPVWVLLTPCLMRENVFGDEDNLSAYVPRIPGGFSVDGAADALFVQDAHCQGDPRTPDWGSGEALGRALVHEMGHHLGLYHVVESNGQTDHLDDTELPNAMAATPLADPESVWSARQVHVMRHNPLVRYSE